MIDFSGLNSDSYYFLNICALNMCKICCMILFHPQQMYEAGEVVQLSLWCREPEAGELNQPGVVE